MTELKLPRDDGSDARARLLYPPDPEDGAYFWGWSDYTPMIDDFGEVLVQVESGDYQGDTTVLYRKDGKYGFLNFGWGSCTGCDALQACVSYAELQELIDDTEKSIAWFDTLQAAKDFVSSEERRASYYWHKEDYQEFVRQVNALTEDA